MTVFISERSVFFVNEQFSMLVFTNLSGSINGIAFSVEMTTTPITAKIVINESIEN